MESADLKKAKPLTTSRILREEFLARTVRNPAYSLRSWARDLGISPTFASLVLSGKKKLSLARAIQISQCLKMSSEKTQAFLSTVAVESEKNLAAQRFIQSVVNAVETEESNKELAETFLALDIDRFKVISQWHHLALLDLTLTVDFKPNPTWIAQRLGITPQEVNDATERLERLGFLEIKNKKWTKISPRISFATTQSEAAAREFHSQMIGKALEALKDPKPEAFALREISGASIAINPARLPAARSMMVQFRRKMIQFLSDGDCTEVYQLNLQLFSLTRSATPSRRKK